MCVNGGGGDEGNSDVEYWRKGTNNLKLQTNNKHEQPTLKQDKSR